MSNEYAEQGTPESRITDFRDYSRYIMSRGFMGGAAVGIAAGLAVFHPVVASVFAISGAISLYRTEKAIERDFRPSDPQGPMP